VRQTMKHEDSYFINPGSATGAYSTTSPDAQPSFVLMDIDGSRVRWACAQMNTCSAAACTVNALMQ
jgi:predicted phosphodiesterase